MTSHKNWAVLLKLQDFQSLVREVTVSYVFEGSSYITGTASVYLATVIKCTGECMTLEHGAVLSVKSFHLVMKAELGS